VEVSEDEVRPVLERLSGSDVRILRPVPRPFGQEGDTRYEIFHDVLAQAVLDWRSRYLKDRELADAARKGIAGVVHGFAGFFWLFFTAGFLAVAFQEDRTYFYGLIWTLSGLAVWLVATRVLRGRWRRRRPLLLLALVLAELAALTAPLSFLVIVPAEIIRRYRRRRRRRLSPA
jgi:hypothetical protein